MTPSPVRTIAWIAAVALALGIGIGLALRPRPDLDGLDRLLASGQFYAAQRQLTEYLKAYPGDESARIFLAGAAVARPDPDPGLALEQVEGLEPAEPRRAARVRAIRGRASFLRGLFDRAEGQWLDALRLDPSIPEVGWGLLHLYAQQGRFDEARQLALRLHAHEPDPRDRLQLLLQMIRFDAHSIEVGSVINQLEAVVSANPDDLASSVALGTALVQAGRSADGLDLLRKAVREHPERPEAWGRLAEACVEAGLPDELAGLIVRSPEAARETTRMLSARSWLASQRQDWAKAADLGLAAFGRRPDDPTLAYRLRVALQRAGRKDDLDRLGPRLSAVTEAKDKITVLYDHLNAAPNDGMGGPPEELRPLVQGPPEESYRRLAEILRGIGRTEEAALWEAQGSAQSPSAP